MRRISPPTPMLHTARLRLRPFIDADANDLFALHSSPYTARSTPAARAMFTQAMTSATSRHWAMAAGCRSIIPL